MAQDLSLQTDQNYLSSPKTPIPSPLFKEKTIDPIRKEYLFQFEKACDEFFNNKSTQCGILIGMVEFSRRSGSESSLQVNWELLDSQETGTREAVFKWLSAVGIPNGEWLYPEDLPLYIQAKRGRRSLWHQRAAARLQSELEELISCNIQEVARNAGTTPKTLSMLFQLSQFIKCYRGTVGIGPFVRGLVKVMLAQNEDHERAIVWSLDDATLTQSGVEFMAASVTLMIKTLGFRPFSLPKTKETSTQLRDWLVHPSLTDFQLASLLRLLTIEEPKLSPGGCSGTCQPSQPVVARLNSSSLSFPRCLSWGFRSAYSLIISPIARLLVLLIRLSTAIIPRFLLF